MGGCVEVDVSCAMSGTAGPSAPLRSGRDDKVGAGFSLDFDAG